MPGSLLVGGRRARSRCGRTVSAPPDDAVLSLRIAARIARALSQIVILSDDAEERISDAGEHRIGGEFSDAVRLFAIMA
jgi:hypothetical protein